MDPDRLDLSPLDPALDELAWERRVRAIAEAAAPELARRAGIRHPLALLAGWARPTLSAAAVLAAAAAGVLALGGADGVTDVVPGPGVAESMPLPAPVLDWISDERAPTVSDLLVALEGDV